MRPKSAPELKQAVILRAAGYTISAIVEKTGISASTLCRHFKSHNVGRGGLASEAISEARQELLSDAGFVSELKHQIAASILDDLALSRQIRETALLALEDLASDAGAPAMIKSRALAALATATKITSDVMRRALKMDDGALHQAEELPVLTVRRMTDEEFEAIKNRYKGDEESVSDDLALIDD